MINLPHKVYIPCNKRIERVTINKAGRVLLNVGIPEEMLINAIRSSEGSDKLIEYLLAIEEHDFNFVRRLKGKIELPDNTFIKDDEQNTFNKNLIETVLQSEIESSYIAHVTKINRASVWNYRKEDTKNLFKNMQIHHFRNLVRLAILLKRKSVVESVPPNSYLIK
ncbi:hypothetical protein [Listeria welshimeri]|uniref:hypothetical protein n=1 Tax=Listeria welshimeri TaxID=1643 RepID=UPI00162339DF|nr:hypothetical protein [Listeria welshimeri]MBC1342369.1 hypothetical protein [Listeria welshimeri]MBC1350719.1 hypothetical protein [Listeria welshimeri]MBC1705813.1 hypothetical protein [Listeria welshimeri]MBF2342573.1 hypothetical protein [Listeria welshimeri]